jgi:hypothetical protein
MPRFVKLLAVWFALALSVQAGDWSDQPAYGVDGTVTTAYAQTGWFVKCEYNDNEDCYQWDDEDLEYYVDDEDHDSPVDYVDHEYHNENEVEQ